EEAWTRAVEILKEEVGDAAVDNGVFYIPREEISVASSGGAWINYGWAFMVLPSGDVFLSSRKPRIAHVPREQAQQLLATFHYLLLARFRSIPESSSDAAYAPFFVFDGRRMIPVEGYARAHSALDGRVRTNAARRFAGALAQSGDLKFIDSDDEMIAALCRAVNGCRRIRNRFEAALLRRAVNGLCECPTAEIAPALAKIKRFVDTLDDRSDWLDTLEDLPVIGRFFGWGESQQWRRVNVNEALWACENLPGKSEAEWLAAYETAFFGEERPGISVCPLVKGHPEEFTKLVLKHWDSLSDGDRSSHLYCARICGDGGRAIAERLTDSEDLSERVSANCVLYKATGDRKYLTDSLEALQWPKDPGALNGNERYKFRSAVGLVADLYKEDPSLEELRIGFISLWRSISQNCPDWNEMSDWGPEEVCAAFIRAGGRENIEIAMEIIRKSSENAQFDTAYYFGNSKPWHPYLWCEAETRRSQDPFLLDAMLEYIRGELLQLKRRAWFPLSCVLASRGDDRLAALFREALPRAEAADAQDSSPCIVVEGGIAEYSTADVLRALIAVVDCINAENPADFLLDLPDEVRDLATALGGAALLPNYSEEEILAFMAEKRCEPLLSPLYDALLARRADTTSD
ncbi:MAG: hypothetical protein ACYTAN_16995, partial [Planctomycetota bacterium]